MRLQGGAGHRRGCFGGFDKLPAGAAGQRLASRTGGGGAHCVFPNVSVNNDHHDDSR